MKHYWIAAGLTIGAAAATFPWWFPLVSHLKRADASGWVVYRGDAPPSSETLTLDPSAPVTQGDRFTALKDGKPVEVLLCGIATPTQEPWATQSKEFLQEALGQSIDGTVEVVPYMEREGAIAGEVFVIVATEPDHLERMPAGEMVINGLAQIDKSGDCWSDQLSDRWEEDARAQQLGMWGSPLEQGAGAGGNLPQSSP